MTRPEKTGNFLLDVLNLRVRVLVFGVFCTDVINVVYLSVLTQTRCKVCLRSVAVFKMFSFKLSHAKKLLRVGHTLRGGRASSSTLVLGIETSCDDTGAAVLDDTGRILGESLHSQKEVHLR